jgi:catechol 2,3-dioxygenase-like lactoylglutathione lyase family enzyme
VGHLVHCRGEDHPSLKNQASSLPLAGTRVRRLDHVNFLSADMSETVHFLEERLGRLQTERIVMDGGAMAAAWFTFSDKSYDLVYTRSVGCGDGSAPRGLTLVRDGAAGGVRAGPRLVLATAAV